MSSYPTFQARGRRRPLAVLAAAAGLALAGCASDRDPAGLTNPAPPVPQQQQTVQWTDSVCSALAPVVTRIGSPPEFDLSAPGPTQQAYSAYLAEAQAEATRALERGNPRLDAAFEQAPSCQQLRQIKTLGG